MLLKEQTEKVVESKGERDRGMNESRCQRNEVDYLGFLI